MDKNSCIFILFACANLWLTQVCAQTGVTLIKGLDEQAQLPYWELSDDEMSLRFVQRLPDQTRGFFAARGFTSKQAEMLAQNCVFQTVFKNSSTQAERYLEYSLTDWIISNGQQTHSLLTREYWASQALKMDVSKSAQIALHWALYPTQQRYEAGDYNWGMTTFGLRPGSRFELLVKWRQGGQIKQARIPEMECAADIHPDPETYTP